MTNLFRIKKYERGYVVEIRKTKLIFWSQYVPFITYRGTDKPFYFKHYQSAIVALQNQIRLDCLLNVVE